VHNAISNAPISASFVELRVGTEVAEDGHMITRPLFTLAFALTLAGCSSSQGAPSSSATSGGNGGDASSSGDAGGAMTGGVGGAGGGQGGGGATSSGTGGSQGTGGGGSDAVTFHRCAYTSGSASESEAYEAWLGEPVPYAEAFLYNGSWGYLEGSSSSAQQFLSGWSSWTQGHAERRLVLAVPVLMSGADGGAPSTLAECAAGQDDQHFKTLAQNLVQASLGNTSLRLGWEFNGNWSAWYASGHADDFAGCFRHIADAMRSVQGAAFDFDWNPAIGVSGGFHADDAYPGDEYVDSIGLDFYDIDYARYPNSGAIAQSTFDASWQAYVTEDRGLSFWQSFAAQHHKPLTFPEWGLWQQGDGHHGGGDNPSYIQNMHDTFGSNVLYACYFDVHAHDGNHQLWPGPDPQHPVTTVFPQSKTRYVDLFGP
jgi:hypothetical protein